MVGSKASTLKESLWTAGMAAFTVHSLIISALALGMARPDGGTPQQFKDHFYVEVVSDPGAQEGSVSTPGYSHGEDQKPEQLDHPSQITPKKTMQKKRERQNQPSLPTSAPPFISSGTDATNPLFNPPPVYPREARRKKIQGVVLIRLSLTEVGEVDKATPLPPRIDPILEEAALKAVHQWKFKPGARIVEVPIEFKLMG